MALSDFIFSTDNVMSGALLRMRALIQRRRSERILSVADQLVSPTYKASLLNIRHW